ncbi:MAG: hypothetical protein K0R83_430 [Caulobacter sp.]|jgi:uncharacterized protein YigA (DUF484 family)|nr:hypothetical protein [Caulobacter sp.]
MSDGARIKTLDTAPDLAALRDLIRQNGALLRDDPELLADLGLRLDAANLVDFGPAALARVAATAKRESKARRQLEATARANFSAQAQTHAAVIDLLEARNHSDLARRVDEVATLRFGLTGAAVALEGPERVPAGWYPLVEGQVDLILGPQKLARMGFHAPALRLFGDKGANVKSMAMVRLAIWEPARQGVLAFGSPEPEGFTRDMGHELVDFLGRVFERTAERWPVL